MEDLPSRDELLAELEPDQEEWERCGVLSDNELLARISEQSRGSIAISRFLDRNSEDPTRLAQLLELLVRSSLRGGPCEGLIEVTASRSDPEGWLCMFRVERPGSTTRVAVMGR